MYDATRRRLLRGREDMLGLLAAQLKFKVEKEDLQRGQVIWVDVSPFSIYIQGQQQSDKQEKLIAK